MPPSRNSKKLTFSLVKGGRGGGQGGGCTARGPLGGYGGMEYPPSPYGGPPMQAQYGGGMGYNQGCPTAPCGGDPFGGGMGYNQGCPTSPCGGDQYGRGSMAQGGASMGGNPYGAGGGMRSSNQYGMGEDGYGMPPEGMRNANCPTSGCPRNSMGVSGSFARNGSIGENGEDAFQVPCMECGALPNPACRLPGQGKGGNRMSGGEAGGMTPCRECGGIPNPPCMGGGAGGAMTPCKECGGLPNPPCMGTGVGGGGGGVGLTPCQECGGLPNPPCGAGTCGGLTPCAECAGNPDAPCLNMGPCDYCPEPPPVDDSADKEVFVLKIGKKKEGTNKKPRMELELVTPKAPVVKPIPKLETRESQYDSKDINGKGKGKGKNGKKKKK